MNNASALSIAGIALLGVAGMLLFLNPVADAVFEVEMVSVGGQWIWEPSELVVPLGSIVRIHLYNEDDYPHGFAISAFDIDVFLPANGTAVAEFRASVIGDYEFYCSIYCGEGHRTHKGVLSVVAH